MTTGLPVAAGFTEATFRKNFAGPVLRCLRATAAAASSAIEDEVMGGLDRERFVVEDRAGFRRRRLRRLRRRGRRASWARW